MIHQPSGHQQNHHHQSGTPRPQVAVSPTFTSICGLLLSPADLPAAAGVSLFFLFHLHRCRSAAFMRLSRFSPGGRSRSFSPSQGAVDPPDGGPGLPYVWPTSYMHNLLGTPHGASTFPTVDRETHGATRHAHHSFASTVIKRGSGCFGQDEFINSTRSRSSQYPPNLIIVS